MFDNATINKIYYSINYQYLNHEKIEKSGKDTPQIPMVILFDVKNVSLCDEMMLWFYSFLIIHNYRQIRYCNPINIIEFFIMNFWF